MLIETSENSSVSFVVCIFYQYLSVSSLGSRVIRGNKHVTVLILNRNYLLQKVDKQEQQWVMFKHQSSPQKQRQEFEYRLPNTMQVPQLNGYHC